MFNHAAHVCDNPNENTKNCANEEKYWFFLGYRMGLANFSHKRFICPQCGRRYAIKTTMNRHIKFECGIEPKFKCTICPNAFHQKANLRRHLITVHLKV